MKADETEHNRPEKDNDPSLRDETTQQTNTGAADRKKPQADPTGSDRTGSDSDTGKPDDSRKTGRQGTAGRQ